MLQGIVNCWKTHDSIAKRSFACVFIVFIEILYYLVFVPCLVLSVNGGFQVGPISIPGDSRQISKYDSWESHFDRGFLGYGAHYQLHKALAHNMEKNMKSHGNLQRVHMQCGHFSFFRSPANQLRDTCWELTFFFVHIPPGRGSEPTEALWFQTGEPRKQRHPLKPGCFTRFFGKNIGSSLPVGKYDSFYGFPTKNMIILLVIGIQGRGRSKYIIAL